MCCVCVLVEVVLVAAARFHYTVDMITKLGCTVTGSEGCLFDGIIYCCSHTRISPGPSFWFACYGSSLVAAYRCCVFVAEGFRCGFSNNQGLGVIQGALVQLEQVCIRSL